MLSRPAPRPLDPVAMIRPRRRVRGYSAILLPMAPDGRSIQWDEFDAHVQRTVIAGLTPAVNMDTGYINLIDDTVKLAVLQRTRQLMGKAEFLAGAYIGDRPGDTWSPDAYRRQTDAIAKQGGTPVVFQSHGMGSLTEERIPEAYQQIATFCPQFVGFELGTQFAPFGRIYELPTYRALMSIPQCIGAKHSSLSRELEWQRLALRDEVRADFLVLTGNDLAIDMVMYGSDYLLGLSTFAPELFGLRDRLWLEGSPEFHELNDLLQYLGCFAFREPVPAYKHSAAQLLNVVGWIGSDEPWPGAPRRPQSDREILRVIAARMGEWRRRYSL
jgi:hypothetical protein